MSRFKVGDKVVCIDASVRVGAVQVVQGQVYTVKQISSLRSGKPSIEVDGLAGVYDADRFKLASGTKTIVGGPTVVARGPTFAVGQRVKCTSTQGTIGVVAGAIYLVTKTGMTVNGDQLLYLDGIGGCYMAHRFTLADPSVPLAPPSVSSTDPSKPFAYPEEDERVKEERAQRELREYKKKMRNFLYGTNSEE